MKIERMMLNKERNVELTAYLQDVGEPEYPNIDKRPAIVILPGGGYSACSDRESEAVAFGYLKAGYQAFILKYSVDIHQVWPNPLNDYEKAMEVIIENAKKWGIYSDKIAVIGFSAGGHLAAATATLSKYPPNALILGYPLLTEWVKMFSPSAPELSSKVHKNMCPCFLFSTANDTVVPIESTIKFINELDKHNIPFESHIYAYGDHGFSTGDSSLTFGNNITKRAKNWLEDSIGFLVECFGDFHDNSMTEPILFNRNEILENDRLSVACSIGYLAKNKEALAVIEPFFIEFLTIAKKMQSMNSNPTQAEVKESFDFLVRSMKNIALKDILLNMSIPNEIIKTIDTLLCTKRRKRMG